MRAESKMLIAAFIVMVMAAAIITVLPAEESEGAASKGQHEKLSPEWVSDEIGILKTKSGQKIAEITLEFNEHTDGKLSYQIWIRNASMYLSNYIFMKQYNEYGNTSSSASVFYTAMKMEYFEKEMYFGAYSTGAGGNGFMADFYVVENNDDETPYADSGTLRVDVKYNKSIVYDYTTELKYDLNEGSGGPSSSTEKSVSSETQLGYVAMTVSDAKDMKRDGFVFKGWSKSLSDTTNLIQPGASISVPAGEATTLYAIWAEDTVTVTLMDGDTVYEKRVVRRGAVPTLPSNLTKADSTFVGWFTDEGLTKKWDSSSKATKDMTLYAGWKPDFYFITDPVADCKVTKVSATTYLFDATVSKDYESSAKITSWTVLKGGEAIHESTGPYMTYQFMEYGKYEVQVKLVNDYGVESVHAETITIEEPSSIDLKSIAIFLIVAVLVVALVVRYLI